MDTKAPSDQPGSARSAPVAVVMGVAGCGTSAIGAALARALGCHFIEGDGLHPPENVARMASGRPLTDAHRAGWLDAIGEQVGEAARVDGGVAACSALKRIYRGRLRRLCPGLVFVHLAIDPETARERIGRRKGHFMPTTLVESQFADLEPPTADEVALTLDGTWPVEELVAAAAEFLKRATATKAG